MKYPPAEFYHRSRLVIKEISPILKKILDEDGFDGFVMVYYVLSRMRLDVAEAIKIMSKDKAFTEETMVAIENLMAADSDTMELREKIERLKLK